MKSILNIRMVMMINILCVKFSVSGKVSQKKFPDFYLFWLRTRACLKNDTHVLFLVKELYALKNVYARLVKEEDWYSWYTDIPVFSNIDRRLEVDKYIPLLPLPPSWVPGQTSLHCCAEILGFLYKQRLVWKQFPCIPTVFRVLWLTWILLDFSFEYANSIHEHYRHTPGYNQNYTVKGFKLFWLIMLKT